MWLLTNAGEGFHGAGNHLSGFRVPEHVGKAKGLQAAEKRKAIQIKMGKGGVLGGASVAGRSVREVLAEVSPPPRRSLENGCVKCRLTRLLRQQKEGLGIIKLAIPTKGPKRSRRKFGKRKLRVWVSTRAIYRSVTNHESMLRLGIRPRYHRPSQDAQLNHRRHSSLQSTGH